jgi:hypothetical protein
MKHGSRLKILRCHVHILNNSTLFSRARSAPPIYLKKRNAQKYDCSFSLRTTPMAPDHAITAEKNS